MAGKTPDMADLFLAFQAFMEQQNAPREKPANGRSSKPSAKPAATRKPASKPATRKPAKAANGVITCGEAWKLLGADPTYTPSNPSAPARNAQLWALNSKGLLRIAQ